MQVICEANGKYSEFNFGEPKLSLSKISNTSYNIRGFFKKTNKKTNSLCTYKIEFKPLLDIEDVHLLIQPSPLQSLEALTVPCQGWAPDCYVVRQNFCSGMCSSLRSPSGLAKSPFFKPKFKCLCSFLSFIIIDKVILFYAPTALYVFTISVISLLFM